MANIEVNAQHPTMTAEDIGQSVMDVVTLKQTTGLSIERIGELLLILHSQNTESPNIVTAMFMGQSEIEHIFNQGSFYNMTPVPDVTGTNMVVVTQSIAGNAPLMYDVTNENIAAGLVSEAMGALAVILRDTAGPDVKFVIGDGAVPGTGRGSLADDTTDEEAGSDGMKRYWSDFVNVKDMIEAEYGPVKHLIECWYNADASCIDRFKECFWPFYFGVDQYGTRVEIGDAVPTSATASYQLDHMIYDATAPENEVGRGLFARSVTTLTQITMMPFNGAPAGSEQANFDDRDLRLNAPARQVILDLPNDPIAQTVRWNVSQSAHWCDFNGGIHPKEDTDPNGKAAFAASFVSALLTASGQQMYEPYITSVTCPDSGAYADVVIPTRNGGKITTWQQQDIDRGIYSKEMVMSLRWDQSTRGARIPQSEMKKLGVDTLPDGVTWIGDRLTVEEGANITELVGWDLSDIWFIVGGRIERVADCLITEALGNYYIVDLASTGHIELLEWCDIIGKGDQSDMLEAAIVGRLSNDLLTGGSIGLTRRCGFFNIPKDVIKSRWPGVIEACYFDSPVNMPHEPAEWQVADTYNTGQRVYQTDGANTYYHESAIDGNTGNQPPLSKTESTTEWTAKDPHVDTINPHGCYDDGTLKIRACYINLSSNREYQPDNGAVGKGMNNGIRYSDDAGLGGLGSVDAQYNIIEYDDGEISFPVALQSNTGSVLDNMWINASASGQYIYPGSETGNTIGTIEEFDRVRTNLTPHRMGVVGFEWFRVEAGARKPVMQPSEASYNDVFKGCIYIIDDGATSGTGIVRFVPQVPFKFGDSFKYLDGQATAITQIDRDVESRLYKYFLAEQTHDFVDQDYPYRGIPIRPQQQAIALPMPAPEFVARSVDFDGADYLLSQALIESGGDGLVSLFISNDQLEWTQGYYSFQLRSSDVSKIELRTDGPYGSTTQGVMKFSIAHSDGQTETTLAKTFFAAPGNGTFQIGEGYHILIGWTNGNVKIVVNRVVVANETAIGQPFTGTIEALGIGAQSSGAKPWTGSKGHLWMNLNHYEDPELAATQDKFVIDGVPQNLGPNGELVTGSAPEIYCDGDGAGWNNRGTAGALTVTGELTASATAPGYTV